jgi:hypothetical protein
MRDRASMATETNGRTVSAGLEGACTTDLATRGTARPFDPDAMVLYIREFEHRAGV